MRGIISKTTEIYTHVKSVLGKDLKAEMTSHKRTWEKRYHIYHGLFTDIGTIDYRLKDLVQNRLEEKPRLLLPAKNKFIEIDELEK